MVVTSVSILNWLSDRGPLLSLLIPSIWETHGSPSSMAPLSSLLLKCQILIKNFLDYHMKTVYPPTLSTLPTLLYFPSVPLSLNVMTDLFSRPGTLWGLSIMVSKTPRSCSLSKYVLNEWTYQSIWINWHGWTL